MSVEVSPDSLDTTRQICPTCSLPASSAVQRVVRGIAMADLICNLGHPWFLKWVATHA